MKKLLAAALATTALAAPVSRRRSPNSASAFSAAKTPRTA
jgi:hypothetical protein